MTTRHHQSLHCVHTPKHFHAINTFFYSSLHTGSACLFLSVIKRILHNPSAHINSACLLSLNTRLHYNRRLGREEKGNSLFASLGTKLQGAF